MGLDAVFNRGDWAAVPPPVWAAMVFWLGCMVGSFLNVCIHRMPIGLSVVNPPSHCPHCRYSIPWYLNVPLLTWLMLRGKCRNCGAPISVRYFLVELLTGLMFLASWVEYGRQSPWLALVYCLFIAGLIAATFIDFEHFIIPDEITIGGMVVGFLISVWLPQLHDATTMLGGLKASAVGIGVGWGMVYAILRLGKLMFGRQKVELPANTKIIFGESAVVLPDREIPYEELFFRKSDVIVLKARTVELADRGYRDVEVRLSPERLRVGADEFDPGQVKHLEAVSDEITLPREAMGFGDVKFMAAIGAFLGWQATLFSLMVSSLIGAVVGVLLILVGKQQWSSRLPYGPYIALAALVWMFGGRAVWARLFIPQ
jgi:leader peptidase (prepilin peptidase)/N-methyltransferase